MPWIPVDPKIAPALSDARRQLHHAAQLATAFGISYIEPRPDDSHTNLEWRPQLGALASNEVNGVRVAVRISTLTLQVGDNLMALRGATMNNVAPWLVTRLVELGFDGARFTLARHYEIPPHAVANGQPFDARAKHLEQLAAWFGNAAALFEALRASKARASVVRCWPHHFDLATLITVGEGSTVGVGMEPGDLYYDEPYYYVNMHPSPPAEALGDSLKGNGWWHTHEWIGAVLPASRVPSDPDAQQEAVGAFLRSAVATATQLVSRC
ncbi:MAG: hypothetical protein H0T48_14500 [Gemmatimonadaceae bacterium]|nr:hypothetical protein [Gemmatimonadaceae bacterium]